MALKQYDLHFVLFSKQGNKIEGVVDFKVCILGIFFPNQGQGFKPSLTHLYPNIGLVPPPPRLETRLQQVACSRLRDSRVRWNENMKKINNACPAANFSRAFYFCDFPTIWEPGTGGSLYVSRKLATYSSAKLTFCPIWEVSFDIGLGEG